MVWSISIHFESLTHNYNNFYFFLTLIYKKRQFFFTESENSNNFEKDQQINPWNFFAIKMNKNSTQHIFYDQVKKIHSLTVTNTNNVLITFKNQ